MEIKSPILIASSQKIIPPAPPLPKWNNQSPIQEKYKTNDKISAKENQLPLDPKKKSSSSSNQSSQTKKSRKSLIPVAADKLYRKTAGSSEISEEFFDARLTQRISETDNQTIENFENDISLIESTSISDKSTNTPILIGGIIAKKQVNIEDKSINVDENLRKSFSEQAMALLKIKQYKETDSNSLPDKNDKDKKYLTNLNKNNKSKEPQIKSNE